MNDYRVLLFYHYTPIEDPETMRSTHLAYCKAIGLLGRVFISSEGINGTVSGTVEQTDDYIIYLKNTPGFEDMIFKADETGGHAFRKMHVRVKNELVNFSLEDDVNPKEITGDYIAPSLFLEHIFDPNTIIIDARNTYEYDLGHFRGAIRPEINNFRELPDWIRKHKHLFENKKVMTYCTGGVRCEKFSGWLKREGFEDVGQLAGGIITYGQDPIAKGQYWDGNCYVFDNRIGVPINRVEHVVVGKDYFTGQPCERYINCANPECNKQILCSAENERKFLGSCSDVCRHHPKNRYISDSLKQ